MVIERGTREPPGPSATVAIDYSVAAADKPPPTRPLHRGAGIDRPLELNLVALVSSRPAARVERADAFRRVMRVGRFMRSRCGKGSDPLEKASAPFTR